MSDPDVVVVGAGNAALVSALSAHESGAKVLICEAANENDMGGNSRFTFAGFRFGTENPEDVRELVPDISDEDFAVIQAKPYTSEDFYDNLMTLSKQQADPELCKMLSEKSFDVLKWMNRLGVEWDTCMDGLPREPIWRLSPGSVFAKGRGKGLVQKLLEAAQERGIEIRYGTSLQGLVKNETGTVTAALFNNNGKEIKIPCSRVILACGSFEANKDMRREHMGEAWANMKVRGTRFNTGKGLVAAFQAGAQPYGNWANGHAVPVAANSADFGELKYGETTRRCLFQFSISVNGSGKRFMDEGADRKTFLYGKTGVSVAEQDNSSAFQIFDGKIFATNFEKAFYFGTLPQYHVAQTLEELAEMMGVPVDGFVEEVTRYNESIDETKPFDTSILDGRGTHGITPPRSNYAIKLDMPPYFAFPVRGGMTFAYGGVKTNTKSQVLDATGQPIRGLLAAGEMAGGYFTDAYPANAGLARGAVTGYNAGKNLEL